jgi:hypothetical protein
MSVDVSRNDVLVVVELVVVEVELVELVVVEVDVVDETVEDDVDAEVVEVVEDELASIASANQIADSPGLRVQLPVETRF